MKMAPNISYKEVGYRIQILIMESGDTIQGVAEELGISSGHFYKLLNGQYIISDKYINSLAKRYDVDPVFLLYGKDFVRDTKLIPFDERFSEDLKHIKGLPMENQNTHMINCMKTFCEILGDRI